MEGSYDSPIAGTTEAKSVAASIGPRFQHKYGKPIGVSTESRNDRSFAQGRNRKRLKKLSFISLL